MRHFIFIFALLVVNFALTTPSASYAQADQTDYSALVDQLKDRDAQIKKLLANHNGDKVEGQMKEQLMSLINETIDFQQMGKLALGQQLDLFTVDQKEEFFDLFSAMIRENSIKNLDIYKADIEYQEVRKDSSDNLIVQTVSSLDNVSTPVYYTFVQHNSAWVIADFAIDNASTAKSYERSFSRLIDKRGVEGLLKVLRKKVAPTGQS
jgi:phospholipid transport system substrate-binding protein